MSSPLRRCKPASHRQCPTDIWIQRDGRLLHRRRLIQPGYVKKSCDWVTGDPLTQAKQFFFCASMPTYVVTSYTAMILLAILALLLSSATDSASQNATGAASLNTMVR